ncbi:MAG: hypothetical protein AB9846_03855 [Tenuifilaceae bacterium]
MIKSLPKKFIPLLQTPVKTIIVVLIIFCSSCSFNKQNSFKNYISDDEFVFVEYLLTQDGEVISGNPPKRMRIDGPTYRFDKETKKLDIHRTDNLLADSIKILLGNGKILKGAAGGGVSTRLTNITNLPYSENKLTINKIDKNGLSFTFNNQKMSIKVDEEWQSSTTRTDTIKMAEPAIVKTKTTYLVRYYGKISKKNISGLK